MNRIMFSEGSVPAMEEKNKHLNLSDDELEQALINCSDQENKNCPTCDDCPYFILGCVNDMMEDAAGRIHNLRKQVDILTKMMKLEDDE